METGCEKLKQQPIMASLDDFAAANTVLAKLADDLNVRLEKALMPSQLERSRGEAIDDVPNNSEIGCCLFIQADRIHVISERIEEIIARLEFPGALPPKNEKSDSKLQSSNNAIHAVNIALTRLGIAKDDIFAAVVPYLGPSLDETKSNADAEVQATASEICGITRDFTIFVQKISAQLQEILQRLEL